MKKAEYKLRSSGRVLPPLAARRSPSEELFTKENYWIIFVPEQILD